MEETFPKAEGSEALHEEMRAVGNAAVKCAQELEAYSQGGGIDWTRSKKGVTDALDQIKSEDLTEKQTKSASYFREMDPRKGVTPDEVRYNARPFLNPETE